MQFAARRRRGRPRNRLRAVAASLAGVRQAGVRKVAEPGKNRRERTRAAFEVRAPLLGHARRRLEEPLEKLRDIAGVEPTWIVPVHARHL